MAEFILRAVARRPDYEARIISLATSSSDPCSLLLSRSSTWARGVTTRAGQCHGETFTHIGARWGEIEVCRLARRSQLSALLQDCDLIQVVAGVPAWGHPVLGLGKPVVLQIATLTAPERRARVGNRYSPLTLWRGMMTRIVSCMDEPSMQQADCVMVENPWMLEHARIATQNHSTIVQYAPPGVDANFYHPLVKSKDKFLPSYILAVGRFSDKRKNAALLLEAYAGMLDTVSDGPDLILAGSDGPPPSFWIRAEALGIKKRISLHKMPSNHDLAELYRNALCLALSSDEEGFGMVVIEAMASGIPVVATRCGGPDGIITDGEDGYLVPCGAPLRMADRLAILAGNRATAEDMGRKARATIEARYTDEIAGNAFLQVYDKLLSRTHMLT